MKLSQGVYSPQTPQLCRREKLLPPAPGLENLLPLTPQSVLFHKAVLEAGDGRGAALCWDMGELVGTSQDTGTCPRRCGSGWPW